MFRMMNGRNRRGMGGGLFLLPGLLFGGLFGIYAILAVLNAACIVIGAVFSGIINAVGSVFTEGFGNTGGLAIGMVIGLVGYYVIRRRKNGTADE